MSEHCPDPRTRKYLTPREVADYYSVSTKTLSRLVDDGKMPRPVMVGGQRRWWGPAIVEFDRRLQEASQ